MNALQTRTRCLTALALFLLLACGKDSTAPAPPPAVASVAVAPSTSSLTVGDTVRLAATVEDARGNVLSARVVTWASSNPAVATVSGTGLVTGVRADAGGHRLLLGRRPLRRFGRRRARTRDLHGLHALQFGAARRRGRADVLVVERRLGTDLRGDGEWLRLLLGRQFGRRPGCRSRHRQRSELQRWPVQLHAPRGRGWARVHDARRGQLPRLRPHLERGGLLLG